MMNMNRNLKPALAELIGTFTLTFIGAGAGVFGDKIGGILGVALAHGVALMVIVYAWGAISGAHVNPAVTFGLAVAGKLDWVKAVWYWIAQFAGAAIAAFLLAYLVVEAVLTYFLVTAVFGTAVAGRNGNAAGLPSASC